MPSIAEVAALLLASVYVANEQMSKEQCETGARRQSVTIAERVEEDI